VIYEILALAWMAMAASAKTLCLPLIRPIGSRRASQVFVMKPTHARDLHYPALARSLHSPMLGCVFRQG